MYKIATVLSVIALTAGSALAQTAQSDPKNAGTKPGQGQNVGADTDGLTETQKATPGASSGTSSGSTGSDVAPTNQQPSANGKGVTPNSNSGPAPK